MSSSTAAKRERMSDVVTREGGYEDLEWILSGRDVPPDGSRLSCGRNGRRRKGMKQASSHRAVVNTMLRYSTGP